jgi:hypothetical protein
MTGMFADNDEDYATYKTILDTATPVLPERERSMHSDRG